MNFSSSENPTVLRMIADQVADRAGRSLAAPICLFLGAGADISSGGLTFSQFKQLAVREVLQRHIFEVSTEAAVEEDFEEALKNNLTPGERALLVENLLRRTTNLHPSDSYKLLVLLAAAGGIDAVVTTNFDVMLETAEAMLGCDVFQVFAAGTARPFPVEGSIFATAKKPYIKLHGDLNSRSITHLSSKELRKGDYDPHLLGVLRQIISTHIVVFAGYSGFDSALAAIIGDQMPPSAAPFWCNPTKPNENAPLYRQIGSRCQIAFVTFDDLVSTISCSVLRKPRCAPRRATFIRRLFDWRVEHCNQTFFGDYGQRPSLACAMTAHRPLVEKTIGTFLASDKTLAIVTGPSGFGKTTMGVRLYDSWLENSARRVILLTAKSLTGPDVESHLAERLGGLGPPEPLSLAILESWSCSQGMQLVVFVDAVNEYSTGLNDCALLLRNIVRLCYYLPERNSSVRILATIRQETWNSILPRLDVGALRQVLWSPSALADSVETIPIGPLTYDELRDAIDRRRTKDGAFLEVESLSAIAMERLRDPFLLSAVANTRGCSSLTGPASFVYRDCYDAMLAKNGAGCDPSTLKDAIARLALQVLITGDDLFRSADIAPVTLRMSILRAALDLGIFAVVSDGRLRFRHDRLQEYFLSIGLSLPGAPLLNSVHQLHAYLAATRHNPKGRAAARMYFAAARPDRFRTIEMALLARVDDLSELDRESLQLVFSFAQEVIYELAEGDHPLAAQYIRAGLRAAAEGKIDQVHLRTLIQCAAALPDHIGIPTLAGVPAAGDDLASTEADVYIVAKLLRRYLWDGVPPIDFCLVAPYECYCSDSAIVPWRHLGRIMRLLGRGGADNLHNDEYLAMRRAVGPAFKQAASRIWHPEDIKDFCGYFRANCDRLLFNATPNDIIDFFNNRKRSQLVEILEDLKSGHVLNVEHLEVLNPYIQSMDFVLRPQNVEYNVATVFFLLSGFNDLKGTLELWERRFSEFDDSTPAAEVDFYQGVLVCLHTLFAIPYDSRLSDYEERVLRDWPTILRCRPGLARGRIRGFQDEFDMIFEDGFGVVYPYGLLTPARHRSSIRYRQYLHQLDDASVPPPLPLYTKYLRQFLSEGRMQDALQVIHALNEVVVAWPIEGLRTLRDAIGHADPLIHRAVVRVLAEAYLRYPSETAHFLRSSGSALTDDDLREIKIRRDPRVGRRQVSQQEWSRIGRFLLADRSAVDLFCRCLKILLKSSDFESSVAQVIREMGLSSDGR